MACLALACLVLCCWEPPSVWGLGGLVVARGRGSWRLRSRALVVGEEGVA